MEPHGSLEADLIFLGSGHLPISLYDFRKMDANLTLKDNLVFYLPSVKEVKREG